VYRENGEVIFRVAAQRKARGKWDQIIDQADVLLEQLLRVMGKGDASAAERASLRESLRLLKALYEQQIRRITTVESGRQTIDHKRELLQKLYAKKAEVRDLRNQLGDRGEDIHSAGTFRMHEANLPLEEFMEPNEALQTPARSKSWKRSRP